MVMENFKSSLLHPVKHVYIYVMLLSYNYYLKHVIYVKISLVSGHFEEQYFSRLNYYTYFKNSEVLLNYFQRNSALFFSFNYLETGDIVHNINWHDS